MTTTLPTTSTPAEVEAEIDWEIHGPRSGTRTAVAYFRGYECTRVTGRGALLHLRIAVWTSVLAHRITQARRHPPLPAA